jgi:hypothetical protein
MKRHSEKNQNQATKILLYSFEDPEGEWEQEGTDWWRWALPVYRMPQGSWDETQGFNRQKIWFIEKVFSEDPTDPNNLEFPPWVQCYWDSQAGRWVLISPGAGSGDYIVFQFADLESSSSSSSSGADQSSEELGVPESCDEREFAEGPFYGEILYRGCGMDSVPGIDSSGLVELIDPIGLCQDRDYRDLPGRRGAAIRMKPESIGMDGSLSASEDECQWVIVKVNFWRVVQVVGDIVFGEDTITIKRKNLTVWDDCRLPDEVIQGTDCPTDGSSSSGSGSV